MQARQFLQSEMMGITLTRKERRALAREQGVPFEPQYNGRGVVTHEEFYKRKVNGEPVEQETK